MMAFGFGGFGLLFMLIFWGGIIALAVWALGRLFPRAAGPATSPPSVERSLPAETPLEILRERYARGEISKAEYEQLRRELEAPART